MLTKELLQKFRLLRQFLLYQLQYSKIAICGQIVELLATSRIIPCSYGSTLSGTLDFAKRP